MFGPNPMDIMEENFDRIFGTRNPSMNELQGRIEVKLQNGKLYTVDHRCVAAMLKATSPIMYPTIIRTHLECDGDTAFEISRVFLRN